ncbi:calcium-binding protein [Candidatus Falkowbacteria bacterium]|nr:calcium-binding protein [Candidatus Falkowbacteria bacterium]
MPIAPDQDHDGLSDAEEKLYGTNQAKPDTDGDGYSDGQEVAGGYNPLGPGKGIKLF